MPVTITARFARMVITIATAATPAILFTLPRFGRNYGKKWAHPIAKNAFGEISHFKMVRQGGHYLRTENPRNPLASLRSISYENIWYFPG